MRKPPRYADSALRDRMRKDAKHFQHGTPRPGAPQQGTGLAVTRPKGHETQYAPLLEPVKKDICGVAATCAATECWEPERREPAAGRGQAAQRSGHPEHQVHRKAAEAWGNHQVRQGSPAATVRTPSAVPMGHPDRRV